ncbi:hypothetical protein H4S07_002175 [Coemansia furcata]|uniref:Uncharacterized protein n=1 Tax=Coemansia furcata TaxID=417177 RepID=A0ACC1LKD4_9FUNG|nr:hypothetical protein H4S07_002175 [Coemansia furcata]
MTTTEKVPTSSAIQQRHGQREGYPWRRVLFGCSVVLLCWTIGLYREYQEVADMRIKQVQDWTYAKIWSHASEYSAERIDPYRGPLWSEHIRGNVLEIGPGLGEALLHLPKLGARYVALEPNPYLHLGLAENAKRAGFGSVHYDLLTCPNAAEFNTGGEKGPVLAIVNGTLDGMVPQYVADHGPYDTVVSSLVLCSVDDLQATLDSILGLLVPGGRFVFIEHVRHTDESDGSVDATVGGGFNVGMWGWIQDLLTPVWSLFTGNCHLNRRTAQALEAMEGWGSVRYSTLRLSDTIMDKMGPLAYGVATKSP